MDRLTLREISTPVSLRSQLVTDVRSGFSAVPKMLPPKYFYDMTGSGIFEAITELPEYYVSRAETAALLQHADEIVGSGSWLRLVELGSGSSTKTRTLLAALHARCGGDITYAPLDISQTAIEDASRALVSWAPWVWVEGVVVDFLSEDLAGALKSDGPQLGIMLGSTLGNLFNEQRSHLLQTLAASMGPDDRFLFGVDLVKSAEIIEPAYNDSAGVTEEFNKNVIRVLQRELGCSCTPEDFRHWAPYVQGLQQVEMRLYAKTPLRITFADEELSAFEMRENEYVLTEVSRKFEESSFRLVMHEAGLLVDMWRTDERGQVALALIRRQ